MIEKDDVRGLIADLFEEEALVIGGLVATHEVDDDVVWSLVRSLDVIRRRTLERVTTASELAGDRQTTTDQREHPHPAVEEMLRQIHEDAS